MPKPTLPGNPRRPQPENDEFNLRGFLERAGREVGFHDHTPVGMEEPTHRIRREPNIAGQMDLRVDRIERAQVLAKHENGSEIFRLGERLLGSTSPGSVGSIGATATVTGHAASSTHALDLITAESVFGRAGVVIEPFPAPKGRIWQLGEATFGLVGDDEDAPDAGVELAEASAWDQGDDTAIKSYGCHIEWTRKIEKQAGGGVFERLIRAALQRGAQRAVDRAIADHLVANLTPGNAPQIADLGGAGITDHQAVAAVQGALSSGAEAIEPASGRAHVGGWPLAGIVPDMAAGAIVGDLSKIVCLVDPELYVIAHRLDTTGAMRLTAWMDVWPVLLDPGRVWLMAGA